MPMLECGEKLLAVRCQICKIAIVIRDIKSGLSGYYLRTEVLEGLGRILALQLHVLMVGDTSFSLEAMGTLTAAMTLNRR